MMEGTPVNERTHLLQHEEIINERRRSSWLETVYEAATIIQNHVIPSDQKVPDPSLGEKPPYNDYTTIDSMHDLVSDSRKKRTIHNRKGLRFKLTSLYDESIGWIAAALMGFLTACVAFSVDVAEATVSDWKHGYCMRNPFLDRENCCKNSALSLDLMGMKNMTDRAGHSCEVFQEWSDLYFPSYAIYVALALAFGIISCSLTMLTKHSLPTVSYGTGDRSPPMEPPVLPAHSGKSLYMAAGSGIPEIKTILSGFVIPNFLDFKVMVVKAVGAVFAVATGMCLGKEGPFVHISTCIGWLVASRFSKYRENGRKMREILSAACAAGLSVAFGAPIGGVLFSYEEISTHFPRKVLWRSFLCSLVAAATLKALNPTGTGKLVLFETNYGTSYDKVHYLIFILLGFAGGIFGGVFCKLNFLWSKWFRSFNIIKNHPVFETALVVLATALLQFPNPLTREPGDATIKLLLVDCHGNDNPSWVCKQESQAQTPTKYLFFLVYGMLAKLVLTIITFGIKVPSGVIIPALDAGAFFGRLIGQTVPACAASPGIFAMVGAAAFLAGVSRMTISLCVIMFELTGELEYVLPHMVAVLVAKWTADAIGRASVYDLAQTVLGHPFLDLDHGMTAVQRHRGESETDPVIGDIIPPARTMEEITVIVPASNKVPRVTLEIKLRRLKERGLMDAGLVLVQGGSMLQGYFPQGVLEYGLEFLGEQYPPDAEVRLLGKAEEGDFDLSKYVDRTPMTLSAKAPMEYAVEMFGKLGLRHLMVLEEGTSRLIGVINKKRMVLYLEKLMGD